mmetsp:Transcript_20360/g.30028  ORF Transcript_20360/g.30028 Transcript_20360/m.30028 type:complete len:83 (+) Transcript_20360:145-393(+)
MCFVPQAKQPFHVALIMIRSVIECPYQPCQARNGWMDGCLDAWMIRSASPGPPPFCVVFPPVDAANDCCRIEQVATLDKQYG